MGFKYWFRSNWFFLLPVFSIVLLVIIFYQSYDPGIKVRIRFDSAQGLDLSKQIDIRYRNLVIGRINHIEFGKHLDAVIVHASVDSTFKRYLNVNAKFWVVRPRLEFYRISDVDTILSGNYIAVDFSTSGKKQRSFVGLEKSLLVSDHVSGVRFKLVSKENYNLTVGSPVYFNKVEIGKVEGHYLLEDQVEFDIFVESEYQNYITTQSVFWNAGAVNVSIDQGRLSVNTTSLKALLLGGINVANPLGADRHFFWSDLSLDGKYTLYPNKEEAFESVVIERESERFKFVLFFSESSEGIKKGSPVKMLGIKIGELQDVFLDFHTSDQKGDGIDKNLPIVVAVVELYLNQIEFFKGIGPDKRRDMILDSVSKNLRFRLGTGNFLTGEKEVEMFFDDANVKQSKSFKKYKDYALSPMKEYENYLVLPTVSSQFGNFQSELFDFFSKVNNLSIEQSLDELRLLLKSLRSFSNQTNNKPQRLIFGD